jgi:DNA-binding IclR family transcriptional regulator
MSMVPTAGAASRSRVQSVSRACELLRVLETGERSYTALALARATGLDRTVVYRLLRTLADDGLVVEEDGSFGLGPGAATLSLAYIDRNGLRRAGLPYAVELHTELIDTPWIVTLAIPARDCAILIERLWKPSAPLAALIDLGTRLPLERSAIGRCFLAYGAAETSTVDSALAARLEEVRAAGGIEHSRHEIRPGIAAVACIVRTPRGTPVGAVCVSGTELDDQLSRDSDVAIRLARTAASISAALG